MNRHVGASFTLSVLVVGFFAIVLYQPERESTFPQVPGSLASEPVQPSPPAPVPRPQRTSGVPPPETPTAPGPKPSSESNRSNVAHEPSAPPPSPPEIPIEPSPGVSKARPDPPELETKVAIPTDPPPRVRAISRTRVVSAPWSAFTLVGDGESLDDVALRVYGTTEKSQWLWRANRDLIDRKDASLRAGMLLRTP
jgi:outer membrane biosynthesis protein TonB